MTGPESAAPFGQPPRDDLTARVFRALYQRFDLRTVGDTYVVVPKGTPCFAGPSLGDIARPGLFDSDAEWEEFLADLYASRRAGLA